jgi:death on curing protein
VVVYLSNDDIIYINHRTVLAHGGNYVAPNNFLHESNLDFLIEAVYSEMFGVELYPKISDKAALYCYNIICNHIFTDGNKRTGLEAALAFLKLNNYRLNPNLPHSELLNFILKIASGQSSLVECKLWFQENIVNI